MKINIIKKHHAYPLGEAEVSEARGKYLIQIGIAEEYKEPYAEKREVKATKEKQENKKANVPTAKKKKK